MQDKKITCPDCQADDPGMGRREFLLGAAGAAAAGLPLWPVPLPWPCSNEAYEACMAAALRRALDQGITRVVFGDLFLEDVPHYRVTRMAGTGLEPLFPLWGTPDDTPGLAREMLAAGLAAVITCVDLQQLGQEFAGRNFDAALLADLPPGADPCGERGEFHTFCCAGPMFRRPLAVRVGELVTRDRFCFADLLPDPAGAAGSPVP